MIIFGTDYRYKKTGGGEFFCPNCRAERPYERKEGRQYGTLYFLPVLPIGPSREVVECTACGGVFDVDILDEHPGKFKAPQSLADMINQLGAMLQYGRPVEYIISDLTAAGLDVDAARRLINAEVGTARRRCDACGLTYADTVENCTECSQPLEIQT